MGHRTREVYDWCRQTRGRVLPLKGEQRLDRATDGYVFTAIEVYPGTTRKVPGGLKLFRIDTTLLKTELADKLKIAAADPGAWHMHAEVTRDWARQMTAEYMDERGVWQCPPGRANHAWDVSVYNLALAALLNYKHRRKPEQEEKFGTRQEKRGSGWLGGHRRGGKWI